MLIYLDKEGAKELLQAIKYYRPLADYPHLLSKVDKQICEGLKDYEYN